MAFALNLLISSITVAETPSQTVPDANLQNYSSIQQMLLPEFPEPETLATDLGTLETLQPKEISIENKTRQKFHVWLKSRQLAQISILKYDLNLKIKIFAPNESLIGETLSLRFGEGRVGWISEAEGQYRVEIISLEQSTSGKYTIDFAVPRAVTKADAEYIKFARLFDEGERLFTSEDQKDLQLAVEKYQAAFIGFRQLRNYSEAARAAGRTGEVFLTWGNNKKAYEYFKTAHDLSEKSVDKILPATLLNLMSKSLIYLKKMSEARQIVKKVFAALQKEQSQNEARKILFEEAVAMLNIGEILYSEGDLPQSQARFSSALKKFEECGDRRGQALGHLFSGYALSDLGYLKDAAVHFQQAFDLLKDSFYVKDRAMVLIVLGGDSFARGETQTALRYYKTALSVFHKIGDTQNEGIALNGIARVYNEMNEPKIAYDIYQQSMRLFEDNNNIDFQSTTLLSFGLNCKKLGKTEEALRYYRKSFRISRFLGKKRIAAYALSFIAEIVEAEGNRRGAITELKKSLKILEEIRDRKGQAETFNSIGDIHVKNREYLPALQVYRQFLDLSRTIGDQKLEAQSLYKIALTSRTIGELQDSLENIEQALFIIESLRMLIDNEILRMSYFSAVTEYYNFYINLLMQLDKTTPGNDYQARAWQASEKIRSRVLVESLSLAGVRIKQAQNPELDAREKQVARAINDKINLHSNLVRQDKPLEEINQSVQEMRRLFIDYEEIRDEIKKEDPLLKSIASTEEIDFAAVLAFMRSEPDSVFMEYLLTDEKSYLWTITGDRIESYELPPRAEIEKTSLEYYRMVSAPPPHLNRVNGETENSSEEFTAKACNLSRMLIPMGALPLDKKRLLIVPDKSLNYVPFDALPGSCDTDPYKPLMTQFEIIVTPSATTSELLRRKNESGGRAPNFVAIFADPVFERTDEDMPTNSLEQENDVNVTAENSLTRLIYSSQEADQIMSMTSPENSWLLSRFDANLDETRNPRLKNYQILHFATHSLANGELPEMSGIYLSQFRRNGEPVSGVLRLQNIYDLNINASLIILSSCESAVGKDVSGEGLISLSRGFMSAGAESVVGSLWKVDDQASAELMKYFYSSLIYDKLSLSEALTKAKLRMSQQPKWKSPYFWSGFVLQGEYRNKIEAGNRQSSGLWAIVKLTSVLLLIAGIIFTLRKLIKRK